MYIKLNYGSIYYQARDMEELHVCRFLHMLRVDGQTLDPYGYMSLCMHAHVHIDIYIYTCIHIDKHMYICTHKTTVIADRSLML